MRWDRHQDEIVRLLRQNLDLSQAHSTLVFTLFFLLFLEFQLVLHLVNKLSQYNKEDHCDVLCDIQANDS